MALLTNEDSGAQVEMLPCPWCGSTDLYAVDHKRVCCRSCDALGPSPVDTKSFINHNNAVSRWNTRAPFPSELADLIRQAQSHMLRTPEADAVSVRLSQ